MTDRPDAKNVLAIIGTAGLSKLVECALAHPALNVDTVSKEKQIVALLGGSPSVVLVGGRVGRRGPLVLCDAVRLRNADVPIVVLLGGETDDEQLEEHKARRVSKVRYLDLRDVPSSVGRGASVRSLVLAVLHVADDPGSAQNWPKLLRRAERNDAAPDQPAPTHTNGAGATAEGRSDEPVPPPIRGPLTADDFEFADRMVAQTRNIDLRPSPKRAPRADAGDATTIKLREQVRELERRLARLAHVYQRRSKDFEASDQRTTESSQHADALATEMSALLEQSASERAGWDRERARLAEQLKNLNERVARAEAQVAESRENATTARAEAGASEARLEEALEASEDALQKLKEESAQERLRQAEEHAKRLFEEVERIQQAAAQEHEHLLRELEERAANAQTVGSDAVLRRLDEVEALVRSAADAPASILARLHELEGNMQQRSSSEVLDRLAELEVLVRTGADAPASILGRLHELETSLKDRFGEDIMARLGELEVLAQGHGEVLNVLEGRAGREQHLFDRLVVALERIEPGAAAALEPEATAPPAEPTPAPVTRESDRTHPGWEMTQPDMQAAPPRDLVGRARVNLQAFFAPERRVATIATFGSVLLVGVLLGLLLAPSQPPPPPPVVTTAAAETTAPPRPDWREKITQDMMRAVVEKRWADAAHFGTHLDPVFERDADALFVWAEALRKAEQLEAAIVAYERLMKQAPEHPTIAEAKVRVANLLFRLERLDESLTAYKAIASDPNNRFRGRAATAVQQLNARVAARAAGKEPDPEASADALLDEMGNDGEDDELD